VVAERRPIGLDWTSAAVAARAAARGAPRWVPIADARSPAASTLDGGRVSWDNGAATHEPSDRGDGMKAAIYRRFGGPEVLEVVDDAPAPPSKSGAVRVRVRAAALNPKDVLLRKGKLRLVSGRWFGESWPRIPGVDFAGEVLEAAGDFAVGQPVYGMIQGWSEGACAEQAVVPLDQLAPKPPSLSMAEAAAVPLAALTSLQALRDLLRVRRGMRVCINGASGGVGTYAVQLAAAMGAEVVAVCSGRNAALVRRLGAAEVVDYTAEDPIAPQRPYDAFYDVFGNRPYGVAARSIRPAAGNPGSPTAHRAVHVTTVPDGKALLHALWGRLPGRLSGPARLVIVRSNRDDLDDLTARVEAGMLRPVIDRVLPLARIAEAHRHLETKRARGKVVVEIG